MISLLVLLSIIHIIVFDSLIMHFARLLYSTYRIIYFTTFKDCCKPLKFSSFAKISGSSFSFHYLAARHAKDSQVSACIWHIAKTYLASNPDLNASLLSILLFE